MTLLVVDEIDILITKDQSVGSGARVPYVSSLLWGVSGMYI